MKSLTYLVLLLALVAGVPASAQVVTSSTGAINGVVTDTSKAVLPGVTVVAQSPQMMGSRETVTDEQGRYQFAAIPPGEYTVTFELAGFSKYVRESIRISLGFTGTVSAELQVASQQETITVTGQSPVVDTTSTTITNNFDAQTMASLPTARDYPALMAETPGVVMTRIDVGGSAAMNQIGYVVYGMNAGTNYMKTEGVVAANLTNHYNDFGAFEEVQIETAAHSAEMPFIGVYTNMITKSGGNQYHGTFYKDYESKKWGSTNIDDAQVALGVQGGGGVAAKDVNKVNDYQDTNIGLGGYIIKDRMWWFGSFRDNRSHVSFVNFPAEPLLQKIDSSQVKVTYNQTQNHKFTYYFNFNMKVVPNYFGSETRVLAANSPNDEDFPIGQTKVQYNAVLSQSMVVEMLAGKYFKTMDNFSKTPWTPRYLDNTRQTVSGSDIRAQNRQLRPQFNGSLSYYKTGWGNGHNFKVGWEIAQSQDLGQTWGLLDRNGPLNHPDIVYILNNGAASQVQFNLTPGKNFSFQWSDSAYLNDNWQLNNRFSFNLGVRFDRYRNGYPNHVQVADQFGGLFIPADIHYAGNPDTIHFNTWGPRLGMVWNVKGDGKTLVKANYGYYPTRPSDLLGNPALGAGTLTPWTRTYTWTDTNRDLLWEPGEEGRLVGTAGGTVTNLLDPNWKLGSSSEFAGWLEREVMADFGIRTGLVYRWNNNIQTTLNPNRPLSAYNVPVSICVPGINGLVPDPANCDRMTVYDLSPAALALPIVSVTTQNPYIDSEYFTTWEISGTKRMTHHWSLNTSFTKTWSAQANPNRGLASTGTLPTNPNQFLGAESDNRFHFTTTQAKVTNTFELPFAIKFSEVVRIQAGQPWGRTITSTRNYGNETIQVEPTATRRSDNINIVDLRLEKGFSFAKRRLGFFADEFNLFNSNASQAVIESSSATFLRPLSIVSPRVARLGMKFEW